MIRSRVHFALEDTLKILTNVYFHLSVHLEAPAAKLQPQCAWPSIINLNLLKGCFNVKPDVSEGVQIPGCSVGNRCGQGCFCTTILKNTYNGS